MIESVYNPSLFYLTSKKILVLGDRSDYVSKFAFYHPHYKKKLWMTNAAYDPYLQYMSDKLRLTTSVYYLKVSFDLFHTTPLFKFLSDDKSPSNNKL